MKLRNKKTGEIIDAGDIFYLSSYGENRMSIREIYRYKSLSKLCEDWEDYTPAEPLIKDEKIRKVVKAWAELFNFKDNIRYMPFQEISGHYLYHPSRSIDISDIEGSKRISLLYHAELCGEEEE